jgi:hypothetical protein
MPLSDAADGGVAGHLGDEVDIESIEGGFQAHAGGGHGGFASGVPGAYYYDIELFGETPHDGSTAGIARSSILAIRPLTDGRIIIGAQAHSE